MDHNRRFLEAIGYIKSGEYENARALYKVPGALQSDLRVIERRIEQQMGKDANRSDKWANANTAEDGNASAKNSLSRES